MASLADDLAADLAEAIGLTEQTFGWNGEDYPCVRTTAPAALDVGMGGEQADISERITVALSAFADGAVPQAGDFVDDGSRQVCKADVNVGHLVLWLVSPLNLREAN